MKEKGWVQNPSGGVRLGQKEKGEKAVSGGTEADTFAGQIVEGVPS